MAKKLNIDCSCDDSVGYICGPHSKEKLSQQLLPCPFCGSTNVKLDNLVDADDFFVSCGNCEIQQIANYSPETAIARWNRRNAAAPQKGETNG
jgi:Lar family restriction alleviation protein